MSIASGQTACELPARTGGPGVEVFGDSALLGLAHALPDTLAGGTVVEDVKPGRTAQQGENVLNDLADSAPGVFVISLAEDDASSNTAYTARIDELRLLLSRAQGLLGDRTRQRRLHQDRQQREHHPRSRRPRDRRQVARADSSAVRPHQDRWGRTEAGQGYGLVVASARLPGRPEAAIRSSTPWVPTAPAMRKWSAWTELSHSGQVGRAQSLVPVPCTCPTHRACAGSCGHSRTAPERRSTRDFGG